MSRVYLTADMKHSSLGVSLPTFTINTTDDKGNSAAIGGLHLSSIAALAGKGKGPEIKEGERFDVKANANAQRTSLSLIVNTSKYLPHLGWSSENGMGKLPLGLGTVATALIGVGGNRLLLGSDEKAPSKKSTNIRRGSDRSRVSEKSKSGNDDRSSRPSHKAQRRIMPPEDRRSHKKSDSGSQSDDRLRILGLNYTQSSRGNHEFRSSPTRYYFNSEWDICQRAYLKKWGRNTVYTQNAIADRVADGTGAEDNKIQDTVDKARAMRNQTPWYVVVDTNETEVRLDSDGTDVGISDICLVIYGSRIEVVKVKKDLNKGGMIAKRNLMKDIIKTGEWSGGKRDNWHARYVPHGRCKGFSTELENIDSVIKSKMDLQDRIYVVAPTQGHTHTIILLHGRDSTASEFASELFESQASDDRILPEIFPTFKWVFPGANPRMSARFQVEMSQWFDMWDVEKHEERVDLQKEGLDESGSFIDAVIRKEILSIAADRIILGGISQGCATAAATALIDGNHKLGGFIGFSSWMPLVARTPVQQYTIPVFLAHCKDDDMVPVENGRNLRQDLEKRGLDVTWKEYEDGGHWINEPQGVDDVVDFLRKVALGH
ncbi:Acyl-protein thioesterase [Lachnellula occidentalis]|uniref:Acyl-protein thioesterase n=1 Tax=Lachnellula occidentalis TaxID=215460 RepID=A0A8H8UIA2_9HELO|nr:Acyl-protein thioesterase [Lachnellula occidentalis]